MDANGNFAHEQNLLRFSERLKNENDPATRKLIGKHLIDEENQFAATAERLDKTDKHITDCKTHITRQYSLIDKLTLAGHDTGPAERLLRNLMELHDLLVSHRQVVAAALDRRAF